MRTIIYLLLLSMMLTACDWYDKSSNASMYEQWESYREKTQNEADSKANQEFSIKQAEAEKTPFAAYQSLQLESDPHLIAIRDNYLRKAIDENDINAIQALYEVGTNQQIQEMDPDAKRISALVVAGLPLSPKIYLRLGRIYEQGEVVIRNTTKAEEFYSQAWLNGDYQGAVANYRLYDRLDNFKTAYLWALRGGGDRTQDLMLQSVEEIRSQYIRKGAFTQEDALRLEGLAANKKVLMVSR